jgi:hypothetical protein
MKSHRVPKLLRSDASVDLGRLDAFVAEERPNFLQVVTLFEHFVGDTMPQVMWLEFGTPDQLPVGLAEPPDVLAGHRLPDAAD